MQKMFVRFSEQMRLPYTMEIPRIQEPDRHGTAIRAMVSNMAIRATVSSMETASALPIGISGVLSRLFIRIFPMPMSESVAISGGTRM